MICRLPLSDQKSGRHTANHQLNMYQGLTAMTKVYDSSFGLRQSSNRSGSSIPDERVASNVYEESQQSELMHNQSNAVPTTPASDHVVGPLLSRSLRCFPDEDVAIFECQARHLAYLVETLGWSHCAMCARPKTWVSNI